MPNFSRLPWINLAIGTSALTFQTAVLYPWHHQLDQDFKELQNQHAEMLEKYHELKLSKLDALEKSFAKPLSEIDHKLDVLADKLDKAQ